MSKRRKILVVCCTPGDGKNTQLLTSLSPMADDVTVVMVPNNTTGLARVYNRYIDSENLIKHDIVLFVHDDVYIDDLKLAGKLYTAVDELQYDIVGLAGAREVRIQKPCLWHKMSRPESWTGAVAHPVNSGSKLQKLQTTTFGPWPMRCVLLDGLFMAVDLKRVLEVGWRFNENYEFHHYDLSSCIDANKKQLRMGTYPIYVTHNSPGLSDYNDVKYQQSETQFYNEYKNG